MADKMIYPRGARARVEEALADTPIVLIHGPRQSGKTTLAKIVGESDGYSYVTFDEVVALQAAKADPIGFVSGLGDKIILDEVQRVPEIFTSIKTVVDEQRISGRFILTGSANILLLPKLTDSMSGRMELIRLHPLAQCELAMTLPCFLDQLFNCSFTSKRQNRLGAELPERITAGGYPAALARKTLHRRTIWYRDYIETLVVRDIREMARITSLQVLPHLLQMAAAQTSHLFNISELAGPFQLSRPTIRDYISLLERLFLLELLPPWHSNRLSRLIKTPKLHFSDTGLASAILGITPQSLLKDRTLLGQFLETFVFQEINRQASWYNEFISFYHFRNKDGGEVDFVLERGALDLAGIEVKASATVTSSDFSSLRKLKEVTGTRFKSGIVLYDGERVVKFGEGLYAVPLWSLWESI